MERTFENARTERSSRRGRDVSLAAGAGAGAGLIHCSLFGRQAVGD